MKKTIALFVIISGVFYLILEFFKNMGSSCNCSNTNGVIGTGSTQLNVPITTAFSLLDEKISSSKAGVIECADNTTLDSLVQQNKTGLISVSAYTTEDGTETALFYVDQKQVKHRILTSNL